MTFERVNGLPRVTFPVNVEVPLTDNVPVPVTETPLARLIGSARATVVAADEPPTTMFEFPDVTLVTKLPGILRVLIPPGLLVIVI